MQISKENYHEINHYPDPLFPVEIYRVDESGMFPFGRGVGDFHWHEELQFTMALQGTLTIQADAQRYTLKEGQAFFINSGVIHAVTELSAGGVYVRSEGAAHRGVYTSVAKALLEALHRAALAEIALPYLIYGNKVDVAQHSAKEIYKLLRGLFRVVHALDERVLEADTAPGLVKVIPTSLHKLVKVIFSVYRHYLAAPLVGSRVERN